MKRKDKLKIKPAHQNHRLGKIQHQF